MILLYNVNTFLNKHESDLRNLEMMQLQISVFYLDKNMEIRGQNSLKLQNLANCL